VRFDENGPSEFRGSPVRAEVTFGIATTLSARIIEPLVARRVVERRLDFPTRSRTASFAASLIEPV
jgi:hypothetical protein